MLTGQWEGMAEAMKVLDSIVSDVCRDDVVAAALLEGVGRPMAAEMRARAPRRPPAPDMADSITAVRASEARSEPGTVTIIVGPRKSHPHGYVAKFVELGTSLLAARPFMRPTADEWEGSIPERFVRAIRPAYERAVARFARRAARA